MNGNNGGTETKNSIRDKLWNILNELWNMLKNLEDEKTVESGCRQAVIELGDDMMNRMKDAVEIRDIEKEKKPGRGKIDRYRRIDDSGDDLDDNNDDGDGRVDDEDKRRKSRFRPAMKRFRSTKDDDDRADDEEDDKSINDDDDDDDDDEEDGKKNRCRPAAKRGKSTSDDDDEEDGKTNRSRPAAKRGKSTKDDDDEEDGKKNRSRPAAKRGKSTKDDDDEEDGKKNRSRPAAKRVQNNFNSKLEEILNDPLMHTCWSALLRLDPKRYNLSCKSEVTMDKARNLINKVHQYVLDLYDFGERHKISFDVSPIMAKRIRSRLIASGHYNRSNAKKENDDGKTLDDDDNDNLQSRMMNLIVKLDKEVKVMLHHLAVGRNDTLAEQLRDYSFATVNGSFCKNHDNHLRSPSSFRYVNGNWKVGGRFLVFLERQKEEEERKKKLRQNMNYKIVRDRSKTLPRVLSKIKRFVLSPNANHDEFCVDLKLFMNMNSSRIEVLSPFNDGDARDASTSGGSNSGNNVTELGVVELASATVNEEKKSIFVRGYINMILTEWQRGEK